MNELAENTLDSAATVSQPAAASLKRDLSALVKPRITLLVVLTTVVGYFLAAPRIETGVLLHTLVGTALLAAASSVLNQVLERRTDALMHRTRERPLPTGRLSPVVASLLGTGMALGGIAELYYFVNLLTALLGAATLFLYVFVYTPLKPYTSLATLVGAVPGAMPPMMGVSAATDALPLIAWLLFGLLFLWQMPHFLAIAWLYREDYERGGLPMLSVGDADGRTARQAVLYAATLLPLSLFPSVLGITGFFYFLGAGLLGLIFIWGSIAFSRTPDTRAARRLLLISVIYLPIVLTLMVVDAKARGPELPTYQTLPAFRFENHDGSKVGLENFAGKPFVADFMFTSCQSVCPILGKKMSELARDLPLDRVNLISFTVDPENDTPAVLGDYARKLQAPPQWYFLTGDKSALFTLIRDHFQLMVDDSPQVQATDPIVHSNRFVLVDGAGRVRGYYNAFEATELAQLRLDLARLLEEGP